MSTHDFWADHARVPYRRKHQLIRVVGRFFAGRDVDGQRRTDATWRHRGQVALTPTGRASRWAHQTHQRRAGVRTSVVTGLVLVAFGLVASPASTVTTLRVMVIGAGLAGVWVVVEKSRRWSHVHTYVIPTAAALADMLGVSRHVDPQSWVHVPTDHRTNPDKTVTIDLPETYHAPKAQQKRHAEVAANKLAMNAPDWGIDWEGDHPLLWLRACPSPPERVTFEQVRELAEKATPDQVVLGLGARMAPGVVSLSDDSPHILASIGTGGGKSNCGKWVALQALRRGHQVVIIDIVKRGASHKWAKGIDGVLVYRHPDTAHAALLELAELVEQRCEEYWHKGQTTADQPIQLVIEESNRTMRKLQAFWVNQLGGTKTSPAVLAIEGILCVGRESEVNAITFGQRMSAQASGGGDARENYGAKLGNRFSRQTAKMLFGDCNPLPPNITEPGRVQVVIGQSFTTVQMPLLPDSDPAPVQWALAGREAAGLADTVIRTPVEAGESTSRTSRDLENQATYEVGREEAQRGAYLSVVPDPGQELVTLAQAATVLGLNRKVLANARDRDPDFPHLRGHRGQALLYSLDELQRWAPNRARQGQAPGGDAS